MPMSSPVSVIPTSFAVVDCETTGLHPNAHHRIIELAVVSLGEDWAPSDVWCSLLCPERDLGPTDIHGIRGRDVRDAPGSVSYTHLRAHETDSYLVCRL